MKEFIKRITPFATGVAVGIGSYVGITKFLNKKNQKKERATK